ncbi:uncharacterized protein C18orf63 [Coregonus clupeaformis]|uniref:uncharacterized protein C18orf63 n=1 Tax=Coregonus clupeaformis TaxID=59861 RepID=UPI001E1C8BF7|nr:uncharacterized protein C18orf63 [Coregonus clupeaformis]XP_041736995.2 uncharacterized protein C18orf63 [Coregonus clupeaformis]
MSGAGGGEQSLFFLILPDLRKLCCVTLSLQSDDGEVRNKQVKTCRELLLLYADIIASPVLGCFSEITMVMAIPFFKRGIVQAYVQRHSLQMGSPQRVLPGILQTCLSYSLTSRLAPNWNKVGQFLIAGRDFLADSGKLNAIVMELSANESQLCVSVEANTVRLPPTRLADFDIPPMVLRNFHSQPDAVIQTFSMSSNWCYILPSMKRGQIVSISHRMPAESPFQCYADIQNHWSSLYGYRLPQIDEEEVIYCSVYFKLVGERLFTYPLSCIRTEPVQRCPRVDLQGALSSFLSHLRESLQAVCGFPARMTSKPCYHTTSLLSIASAQVASGKPVNLTTKSASRPVLSQLHAPCPIKPSFGGAPGAQSLSQPVGQSSSSSYLSTGRTQGVHPTPPQSYTPGRGLPSSSLYPSAAPPQPTTHPQPSQALPTGPKMVPIFKNKALPRHVNVTQLLAEKQQRRAEEQRQTPVSGQKRPCPAFSSSFSFWSVPPSLFSSSTSSNWTQEAHRPHFTPRPRPEGVSPHSSQVHASESAFRVRDEIAVGPPHPLPSGPLGNRGGDWFESKPKKPKSAVQDVDVEKHARSNQLSKINVATLQAWLKSRRVVVRSKDKKEELVSKVMRCLSES